MASEHRENVKVIREGDYEHRQRVVEHRPSTQNVIMSRVNQLLWLITTVIEILIGLRIVLKLVAANPINGFADFIYNVTFVFVAPFATLLQNPAFGTNGAILELTSLIAMLVYFIVALVLVSLIRILLRDTSSRSVKTVERS